MVKVGPDNLGGQLNAYAGYLPNGLHTGFSMMHLSGTGGIPTYGVVSQLPVIGDVDVVGRQGHDVAEVGYYKSRTDQGITVELGASEHAAMYQYTFRDGGGDVLVDLEHRLRSFRGQGLDQGFTGGNITIDGDKYAGSGTYSNGYNRAPDWTIYFCTYTSASETKSHINRRILRAPSHFHRNSLQLQTHHLQLRSEPRRPPLRPILLLHPLGHL
jgi:putative alpha-1,2-mannosidase